MGDEAFQVSRARGFGLGIVLVVGGTQVVELVPPERRGEGLGLYGVAVGAPFVAALPLVVGDFAPRVFDLTEQFAVEGGVTISTYETPGRRPG